MEKDRLQIYRKHFNCRHDGETLLVAAEHALFPEGPHNMPLQKLDDGSVTNRQSSRKNFEEWGVRAEMTRDEIISLLSQIDVTDFSKKQRKLIDSAILFVVQPIGE